MINKEIDKYWKSEWEEKKQGKSSLKYMSIQENPTRNPLLGRRLKLNSRSVAKTTIKVK